MSQVFISCARPDLWFVESHLTDICRACGYNPWYDIRGLALDDAWEKSILAALEASRFLLVVLSPDAAKSEWVLAETHLALQRSGLKIIPLMLRDCNAAEVHVLLSLRQYLDFRRDIPQARVQLAECLATRSAPPMLDATDVDPETALIAVALSLLSRLELNHLKNLAQHKTFYTGRRTMRHEIRHLCDLGLVARRDGRRIGSMKDGTIRDLAEVVELTRVGRMLSARIP